MRLGEYVRTALAKGELVNDDSVRRQARLVMYGDNDAWNQTPADNAEWLRLFKDGLNLNAYAGTSDGRTSGSGSGPGSSVCGPPSGGLAASVQTGGSSSTCFDLFGSSPGVPAQIPLAWQTPECLAEFRHMAQQGSLLLQGPGTLSCFHPEVVPEQPLESVFATDEDYLPWMNDLALQDLQVEESSGR